MMIIGEVDIYSNVCFYNLDRARRTLIRVVVQLIFDPVGCPLSAVESRRNSLNSVSQYLVSSPKYPCSTR